MSYNIRQLEPQARTLETMERIWVACFGMPVSGLLLANWSMSDPRTVVYGAFDGDRLVAFNAFLAHPALHLGKEILLFQSCHSATDPEYRKKGLFTDLIEHAKRELQGAYIIGFPNAQSKPIFLGRLGFRSVGLKRAWIPCQAGSLLLRSKSKTPDWTGHGGSFQDAKKSSNIITLDEDAAAAWKMRELGDSIVRSHNSFGNTIWGKIESRKIAGISMRFLSVGGSKVEEPRSLARTIGRLGQELGVFAIRAVGTPQSAIVSHSRIVLHGRNTEDLIWHPLNVGAGDVAFALDNGIKDVAFWP